MSEDLVRYSIANGDMIVKPESMTESLNSTNAGVCRFHQTERNCGYKCKCTKSKCRFVHCTVSKKTFDDVKAPQRGIQSIDSGASASDHVRMTPQDWLAAETGGSPSVPKAKPKARGQAKRLRQRPETVLKNLSSGRLVSSGRTLVCRSPKREQTVC